MSDKYAVIGNPIAQSRSPQIHAAFARQLGHEISYVAMLANDDDDFVTSVQRFAAAGGKGMNVTAPFKLAALQLADGLSPQARAAQAVNTLSFTAQGIFGDNTDGLGLVHDIRQRLQHKLQGARILLAGAGGAARGVLLPLLQENPASLMVVNRNAARAHELVGPWLDKYPLTAGGLEDAAQGQYDVVINATSAGLGGHSLNLGSGLYAPGALAYDMVYGPDDTHFMQDARAQGAAMVADGIGMLVGQAAESYRIWRGVRPDTGPVIDAIVRDMQKG